MGSRIRLRTPLLAVALLAMASVPAFAQTFSGLMSGSWWDASRAGEGQFVTFESAGARNVAYLAYFTYTAGGTATWHVGSADYAPGTTRIDIPLVTGAGPGFGAGYRPADLATAGAGTATLEFVACNRMRMRHSAMAGVTLELTRLVGPLGGAECTAPAPVAPAAAFAGPMSGHWWNAARAGEGQFVTFEAVGGRNVAYLAYFTYTTEGRASWLVGSADHPAGATSVTIPLITGAGPSFGAGFRPADFVPAAGGSARLDFLSCSAMRLTYSGTQSFAFDLSRLVGPLTGHACVDAVPARLMSGPSPFPASCGAGAGVAYVNAEVEPSLAANPSNPGHLVAMWQQDRWSNGSARGLVAAVSFDGGATWATRPMAFSRCGGGRRRQRRRLRPRHGSVGLDRPRRHRVGDVALHHGRLVRAGLGQRDARLPVRGRGAHLGPRGAAHRGHGAVLQRQEHDHRGPGRCALRVRRLGPPAQHRRRTRDVRAHGRRRRHLGAGARHLRPRHGEPDDRQRDRRPLPRRARERGAAHRLRGRRHADGRLPYSPCARRTAG